jgi:hypothetical protein
MILEFIMDKIIQIEEYNPSHGTSTIDTEYNPQLDTKWTDSF